MRRAANDMTMTKSFTIDLDRSELTIDLQSEADVFEPAETTVTAEGQGPLVVVSKDRLVSLELTVFTGLSLQNDIVQLDAARDIAAHIAVCDVLPSLFMVAASVMAETRTVLAKLGLDHIDVIAI